MRLRQQAQPFGDSFRGLPRVIPSFFEGNRMYRARKGSTVTVEQYATAPVGTEVWIRHQIRYSSAGHDTGCAVFQCRARVTASTLLKHGTFTHFPRFRTTFVLIGEPECSDY